MAQFNEIQIFVNQYNLKSEPLVNPQFESMLGEELSIDWIFIKDNYVKVDIDTYPGFTKMQKFELILANYSTNQLV